MYGPDEPEHILFVGTTRFADCSGLLLFGEERVAWIDCPLASRAQGEEARGSAKHEVGRDVPVVVVGDTAVRQRVRMMFAVPTTLQAVQERCGPRVTLADCFW